VNEERIEETRRRLLALRAELAARREAFQASGGTVELDQARTGRLTRMDAMQAREMAIEAERRDRERLARVEGALQRIEAGGYGECFVCGEPIDARRLAADPTSTRCLTCAES